MRCPAIAKDFGPRVGKIVGQLTNPEVIAPDGVSEEVYECMVIDSYVSHARETIHDPAAFYVKLLDMRDNLLRIGNLENLDQSKYQWLKRKYGPVVRDVLIPAFQELDLDHPLFPEREKALVALRSVAEIHYAV